MEFVLQYMHRRELPCDEQSTSIFKVKTYWVALGYSVAALLGLDEDDSEEQFYDPSAVRELVCNTGTLEYAPFDQQEHYHKMVLGNLIKKLDDLGPVPPTGDWYFKCSYQDPDQDEIKTMILNYSS